MNYRKLWKFNLPLDYIMRNIQAKIIWNFLTRLNCFFVIFLWILLPPRWQNFLCFFIIYDNACAIIQNVPQNFVVYVWCPPQYVKIPSTNNMRSYEGIRKNGTKVLPWKALNFLYKKTAKSLFVIFVDFFAGISREESLLALSFAWYVL